MFFNEDMIYFHGPIVYFFYYVEILEMHFTVVILYMRRDGSFFLMVSAGGAWFCGTTRTAWT